MKAKMARMLAGIVAATMVMSGMTPCVAYAQEIDEAEVTVSVEEQENAPEAGNEAAAAGEDVTADEGAAVDEDVTADEGAATDVIVATAEGTVTEAVSDEVPETVELEEPGAVEAVEAVEIPESETCEETDEVDHAEPGSYVETVRDDVVEAEAMVTGEAEETKSSAAAEAGEKDSSITTGAVSSDIEIPRHEYSDDVVHTDIKTIKLTQSKEKRIITEYLENGWRIVTTQYIQDGEVVSQSVYDQVAERREMQSESEETVREIEEQQRIYREEEERKKAALKDEEIAGQVIADTLESLTPGDLLEIYSQMSEGNDAEFIRQLTNEVNEATSSDYGFTEADAKKIVTSVFKNLIGGVVKALPGTNYYGDVVKGLIFGSLGLEDEQADIQAIIDNSTERLHQDLVEGFAKTERNIDNYGTLKEYGSRLDEFSDYASMRASGIKEFNKPTCEYSELEKKVRTANLIGTSDEWYTGANNGNIMKSFVSAAEVFKGQKAVDTRDIFNVIYDINKETSLFSGEAMAKSQGKIEKAVTGFIKNCSIIMECLKAHDEIADFTEDEIASLDPQTRAIYDRIHTSHTMVASMQRKLAAVFMGDKASDDPKESFGLLDKANQYYSKSKTTYINYGTIGDGIALKDTLNVTNGSDYIREDKYTDLDKIDNAVRASGLTAADIDRIAFHAKVHGMTIAEYLNSVGFNTDNLNGYHYLLANSYYYDEDTALGMWKLGPDHEGAQVYDVHNQKIYNSKENVQLSIIDVCLEYGIKIKEEINQNLNQGVAFVTFEKE